MSVSATALPGGGAAQREERRVILASSLGTVFEWYDFYLYGSLAVFFGRLFFPPGNDTAALLASLATFGAGFARAAARRAGLRADRRSHRPQVHVPHHDRGDGPRDLPDRSRPHVRIDRLVGAGAPGDAAPAAGSRARRRVRRRGDLRGRARAERPARLLHELHPDHGDARDRALARDHPRLPSQHAVRDVRRLGLAGPVLVLGDPARRLRLHPAEAAGVADIRGDQGGGPDVQGAAEGELHQSGEPEARADRAVRCDGWRRAWSGTRASSTRSSS